MVSAVPGTLVTCDVPVKQFLLWLHETKPEKFILFDLDESHLLVQSRAIDYIRKELNELYEENQYSVIQAAKP